MTLSEMIKAARDAGIVAEEKIYLDQDIPDTVEKFYRALGCPFTDSKTGETITELAPCLLYTSPSPRDRQKSRMPSSA